MIGPLRAIAISAAKLELTGHVFGQVIRFFSGLILSRLLFPEAFGLSVIVGLISQGLSMISNVGASQSIIQSPRGNDPVFLNTAFTLLAIRGCLIWASASIVAYPVAILLHQPELASLIPVGSLGVLISGFSSTSIITLRRQLHLRPLIVVEIVGQLLTFVASVTLAWTFRSVWGLIAAGLIGSLYSTVVSHFLKVGYQNRFRWDHEAWREIYLYGRWVQASSAVSFASSQADKLLIAHYLSMSVLGIYNYAVMLADSISSAIIRITHGVLFPVFSQIHREDPGRLPATYYRIRLRMDLVTMPLLGLVAVLSQYIVDILFDSRYQAAGWMLQALCIRAAMHCMLTPLETYLFSIGLVSYGFYRDLARAAWILLGIPILWALDGGLSGLVWTVALSEIPVAAVLWIGFYKLGIIRFLREAIGPTVFVASFFLGKVVRDAIFHSMT
jgi:O-antigen/teichoic acid export membrane protein